MFLLATKALAILFFFLTVINIPVYAFYYASNPTSVDSTSLQDYFASLSLGNIGQSEHACDRVNWAVATNISLSCSMGTLQDIRYFGISKDDTATCMNLLSARTISEKLVDGCYSDFDEDSSEFGQDIHSEAGEKFFKEHYNNNCKGKASCIIPIGPTDGKDQIKKECQSTIDERWYHSKYVGPADKELLEKKLDHTAKKDDQVGWVEPWLIAMA